MKYGYEPSQVMKARKARDDMQDYKNQSYIGSELDDNYFEALIDHDCILFNAGLDAIDTMPSGCMTSNNRWFDRGTVTRGIDLAEQKRIDSFISELMLEID